ncbi:N-acetyl-gamma-glutamyl-phosphate reductase [Psychrobacillus sp. BL-248-WT-3]|uniref:N-acetyl-gamma-glutamyl-phosphate reductase n=1 Tax=Psychrobacillus sp. BL-248-WT-3 TaxID=2725306 RepID=UPI00146BA618|nr:N-acetyl-gamma-glutamyl-phosphate reductase [Psychrobacillus sp. BL-248-WT-3]NME05772.1 N-acetyl-gamma-glutamyl-phosphate reductase [Psychrobacillus sp. BL-248-WT-3]
MKVGIIGATGYGGLELVRFLHNHPEVEVVDLFSSSEQGIHFSDKYSHLMNIHDQPLLEIESDRLAEYDVLFTSTPSGVSSNLLPALIGKKPKLIDLSGDFRLKDLAAYEQWYKKSPAPADAVEQSVYGLTEWNTAAIAEAQLIANPGCYPTAVLLSLLALIKENLIDASHLVIDAKSGISGAGNKPSQMTHYSETNENTAIYKLHEHQHIPEIEQAIQMFANQSAPITFTTHLVPMKRGILATSYAPVNDGVTEADLVNALQETYVNHPFVRIIKDTNKFGTNQVYGSNYCDIHVKVDPRTNRATIVSVIDNLVKGAAGQAIQNMNVQFNLNQTTGLSLVPLFI